MADSDWLDLSLDDENELHIGDRERKKLQMVHMKEGFREGYDIGRESKLQEGFNSGYRSAAEISFTISSMFIMLDYMKAHCKVGEHAGTKENIEALINEVTAYKTFKKREYEIVDTLPVAVPPTKEEESSACGSSACCKSTPQDQPKSSGCCGSKKDGCCKGEPNEEQQENEPAFDVEKLQEKITQLQRILFPKATEAMNLPMANPFRL